MSLTPKERSQRAALAAHEKWARTTDRQAATSAARLAADARFENIVDPERVLPAEERARRAGHARQAHMLRMSLLASKARRRKAVA